MVHRRSERVAGDVREDYVRRAACNVLGVDWVNGEHRMRCEQSGLEHVLEVALPLRFPQIESPPLVVCLDGTWMFGAVRDATRIMSMQGEAPEAVVIGLSFDPDRMGDLLAERARWYTPTPYIPPAVTGVKGLTEDETGRAGVLRQFLADQLLPFTEATYGIGERWFVGHSFGGLFGLSSLFDEPELFDKWVLASPSIWWDDRSILGVEEAYADDHDDLAAEVFLSAGGLEGPMESTPDLTISMLDDVRRLTATLRSRRYPNLRLAHAVLEGEGHHSTIGAAISHGFRALMD